MLAMSYGASIRSLEQLQEQQERRSTVGNIGTTNNGMEKLKGPGSQMFQSTVNAVKSATSFFTGFYLYLTIGIGIGLIVLIIIGIIMVKVFFFKKTLQALINEVEVASNSDVEESELVQINALHEDEEEIMEEIAPPVRAKAALPPIFYFIPIVLHVVCATTDASPADMPYVRISIDDKALVAL
uniref:Uncharacterized protein n=1 Tax=Caenorhabditis japonica TaxID=281687 RepID=A0A8R1ET21_CAEJA